MANKEQLDILRQGPEAWNRWRHKEGKALQPNLSKADLSGANLDKVDLSWANLSKAEANLTKLRGADLSWADLRGANLGDADLIDANLRSADLSGAAVNFANLPGANLSRANLSDSKLNGTNLLDANLSEAKLSGAAFSFANLRGANLRGANFHAVKFNETIFGDTDLSDAIDLDTCTHVGPSTLDHRTIAKSGKLPLSFLRGCGLPDTLIAYLPSLLNEPIEFYSCFISYSTKDQDFADRLYADLQNKGVRCWFAPHDMQGGKKIHEQIDEAIRVYQRLLLILSSASMESEWVKTEIAKARRREQQEKRRMLFPVRLVGFETLQAWECFDADVGKDSAREVREFYIPDFSNWKDHDSYQKEFERLLRDLKPERKDS